MERLYASMIVLAIYVIVTTIAVWIIVSSNNASMKTMLDDCPGYKYNATTHHVARCILWE